MTQMTRILVPAVDVVTHEEVVGLRGLAADAEQLDQIVELAVDVTAHSDRAAHALHVGFLHQHLASLQESRNRANGVNIVIASLAIEKH